jgi:hypothetical protein
MRLESSSAAEKGSISLWHVGDKSGVFLFAGRTSSSSAACGFGRSNLSFTKACSSSPKLLWLSLWLRVVLLVVFFFLCGCVHWRLAVSLGGCVLCGCVEARDAFPLVSACSFVAAWAVLRGCVEARDAFPLVSACSFVAAWGVLRGCVEARDAFPLVAACSFCGCVWGGCWLIPLSWLSIILQRVWLLNWAAITLKLNSR